MIHFASTNLLTRSSNYHNPGMQRVFADIQNLKLSCVLEPLNTFKKKVDGNPSHHMFMIFIKTDR